MRADRRGRRLAPAVAEPDIEMTASVAALALSASLLVSPSSPRRRLARTTRRPRRSPARFVGWLAVCAGAAGVVLLPLTTVLAAAVFAATAGLRYRCRRRSRLGFHERREIETAIEVFVGELRIGKKS